MTTFYRQTFARASFLQFQITAVWHGMITSAQTFQGLFYIAYERQLKSNERGDILCFIILTPIPTYTIECKG